MGLPKEQENFIKLARIFIEIVPKHLRTLFLANWNAKYPNQPWTNDATSGHYLYNAVPLSVKGNQGNFDKTLQQMILAGNYELWDPSALFFVLLYAGLNLIDKCRPHNQKTYPFTVSENIDRLCVLRNSFFGHAANMSVSDADFLSISTEIQQIANDVFSSITEDEIKQIISSQMETQLSHDLEIKLDKEKLINKDFSEWISRLEEKSEDRQKEIYRRLHRTHAIYCVDEHNRIVLKEVDVSDFTVELRKYRSWYRHPFIFRDEFQNETFHNETKRYLENCERNLNLPIDKSELISKKHRVTFVSGIAGMGKSILAKQLAYGWANGDIYENFKMCVMFECKELNHFKDHEGASLTMKYDILDEFIKSRVNCDLGDGQGVLFIVDGLDELYDITERNSIIKQLLCGGMYCKSKVIITGRPYVEGKLSDCLGDDWHGVEMTGLPQNQINSYIDKLSPRNDYRIVLVSNSRLSIVNYPQFLNTLCCVAILMKGQAIRKSTELYCWTIYIMLRQYIDKQEGRDPGTISQVFKTYSKTVVSLSKLCYDLLKENKIIFEGNIESALGSTEEEKKFIKSIFVDVSDNFKEKYQFKHPSLMEFLSSLHICKEGIKSPMEAIKDNIKKGFVEVASFVSRLLSGFSYEGIIKEMLGNVIGIEKEVNEKELLGDVIELLNMYSLNVNKKLCRLSKVITCLPSDNLNDTEFVKSIITDICHGFPASKIKIENLCKICKQLESSGWKEDNIRMAFSNVQFEHFMVSDWEQLDFAAEKNFFRICTLELFDMKESLSALRRKFQASNENGYCGHVRIDDCTFHDEVHEYQAIDRRLAWLDILQCELKSVNNFINLCDWGMSCEKFWLRHLDISIKWWEILVGKIVQRKDKGDFQLKELSISDCTTTMNGTLAMRIVQCGVKLRINYKKVTASTSSSPPSTRSSSSLMSTDTSPVSSNTDVNKGEVVREQFIFDRSGGSMKSHILNVSLDVPENSVDSKIHLDISITSASSVPPITFEFGERALSGIIDMKPIGILFKKAATITVRHSVIESPLLSSIGVKFYNLEKKAWITLPRYADDANSDTMAISAKISVTSFYVVCLSLDSVAYTIPKAGISFSPFDSKYGLKVIFEEGTFGDESAILHFKMNVFSERACNELERFGLQPFPILHVSEIHMRHPMKPVTIELSLNSEIQRYREFFILCGDINGFRDETDSTSYEIGDNFITVQLNHFSIWSFVIACRDWTLEKVVNLFGQFSGPRYLVTFSHYYKDLHCGEYSYQVGCCKDCDFDQLGNRMKECEYYPMAIYQATIYGETRMRVELVGRYQMEKGSLDLTFFPTAFAFTDPFKISQRAEEPNSSTCNLLIFREGDEKPLKEIPFTVPSKGTPRNIDNNGSMASEAKTVNVYSGANVMFGDRTKMKIIPSSSRPCLGGENNQEALTYPSQSGSHSNEDNALSEG